MEHLALIMDGNRRWASRQGHSLFLGPESGTRAFEVAIECCLQRKITFLSVYALSVENLQRSDESLLGLYGLLNRKGEELAQRLSERNVEMRFVGDRSLFDASVVKIIEHIEQKTAGNTALKVTSLFCYGGQQEIVAAAKKLAQKVARGEILPEEIDTKSFGNELFTVGTPPPELIVRTGGAMRLSNFLLYQAAYSELVFLDILWPDLTSEVLSKVLDDFKGVVRNFGV